jgi:hypothetical protein
VVLRHQSTRNVVVYLVGAKPGQTQYIVPVPFSSALGLDEIERLFDTLLPLVFATRIALEEDRPA